MKLDIKANRLSPKWPLKIQIARVIWGIARPAFRLSPRIFWSWRRLLLRMFGATVGKDVHIYPTVRITMPWNIVIDDYCAIGDRAILYALGNIQIGARTTISQGAHLCAASHDWRKADRPLLKLPINIGDDAWICADAFVGPGVTVGRAAIVGARAVAMRDIPENAIVTGNPAVVVSSTEQLK